MDMLSNNKKLIAVIGATGQKFAGSFPGATEIAEMSSYWEAHTYLGSDSSDQIVLAGKIAGRQPTTCSTWALANFHLQAP
jgi:hypothetical protein